jgi:transglutaminase-like putative cysteine protease
MLLKITHETHYRYSLDVAQAHHVAMLTPLNLPKQTTFAHSIEIFPTPATRSESLDALGQTRTYFEIASPHRELRVVAQSDVGTLTLPAAQIGKLDRVALPVSELWKDVANAMQYVADQPFDVAREYAQPSVLAPADNVFFEYVRDLATDDMSVFRLASLLCQRIHWEFKYVPAATDVNTQPAQALELKRGVCQDFAQVAIACFRSLGLPAKYVSGYLLTEPPPGQPRLIGADASHAWIAVYSPSYGWLEFDPTNNCLAGESHVVIAYGRDYSDVPPLRGVIRGGGAHELKVAVTVMPIAQIANS